MNFVKRVEDSISGFSNGTLKKTGGDKTYIFFEDSDGFKYRLSRKKKVLYIYIKTDIVEGWQNYSSIKEH